jgi:hypothetical protein
MGTKHESTVGAWQNDWLYLKLLNEGTSSRDALIEEYDAAAGCFCRGRVIRSWHRDKSGIREITDEERRLLRLKLRGRTVYPFTIISFHITPDRSRVVFGFRDGGRAGKGWCYVVKEHGQTRELQRDPAGGGWIS